MRRLHGAFRLRGDRRRRDRAQAVEGAAQALRGIRTEGPMAPDIPLDKQRPAEYVFSRTWSRR